MPKLLKSNDYECLFCHETKSILIHLGIGSIIPTFMAWIISFQIADVFKTYDTPRITLLNESMKGKKEYFRQVKTIFRNTNKNFFASLVTIYMIQFVLCSFILYMQQRQFKETIEPLQFSLAEIKQVKK